MFSSVLDDNNDDDVSVNSDYHGFTPRNPAQQPIAAEQVRRTCGLLLGFLITYPTAPPLPSRALVPTHLDLGRIRLGKRSYGIIRGRISRWMHES